MGETAAQAAGPREGAHANPVRVGPERYREYRSASGGQYGLVIYRRRERYGVRASAGRWRYGVHAYSLHDGPELDDYNLVATGFGYGSPEEAAAEAGRYIEHTEKIGRAVRAGLPHDTYLDD